MADEIFVGSVAVGVVPDARGWNRELRRQLVPSADTIGREYGNEMGRTITREMGEAGSKSGGAFSDTFRKRAKAALDALPRDADGPVAELRKKLEALANSKIIDGDKAVRELSKIGLELDKLGRSAKDIELRFDTKTARAQLAMLKREVGDTKRGGFLSNLFGGAGFQVGGLPTPPGGAAAGGGGIGGTAALYGGGAAAVAAGSPFLGQIAAGGVTGILGTALAGLGLIGASMDKSFQDTKTKVHGHVVAIAGDFTKFKDNIKKDIEDIGKPFVPVLHSILTTIMSVMAAMTPIFTNVMRILAGPFKLFSDTLIRTFTNPLVKASIEAVATSFGLILRAVTPQLAGMVNSIAQGIIDIANAIADNPGAFASFINFLFHAIGYFFSFVAWLTRAANYIESHWFPVIEEWVPKIGKFLQPLIDAYKRILPLVVEMLKQFWGMVVALAPVLGALAVVLIKVLAFAIQDVLAPLIQHVLLPLLRAIVTVAQWVRDHWRSIFHEVAVIFDGFRHEVAHIWDMIWNNTVGRAIRGYQDVINIYRRLHQNVINWWHNIQQTTAQIWDTIWNNTVGRAIRGVTSLINVIGTIKGRITSTVSNAVSWLLDTGKNIITGMLNGIKNAISGIRSWIKTNVVDPVVNAVKSWFGIKSPATLMVPLGANIIKGLLHGMLTGSAAKALGGFIGKVFGGWPGALAGLVSKSLVNIAKLPAKALHALGSVAGKIGGFFARLFGGHVGGGVQQWAGVVAQALAMLGLPISLSGQVLYQMQTESGGNPNSINTWDINAQRGDPSRGLMQTIGSTFAAYHVPGTSNNIYDPLANVAAAINYARHVYGPTLMRGGMGIGSGHGYDQGGWWPHGTFGWNMSGAPELVLTQDQLRGLSRGGDGAVQYHAHFDGLTGAAIESHVQTAFTVMSLTQGALSRNGRRS